MWILLPKFLKNWKEILVIVKPKTVICWHRQGFKLFWRWKLLIKLVQKDYMLLISVLSFAGLLF